MRIPESTPAPTPPELPHLSCEVCMTEIPASEAQSSEASDYVAAVCGLECYAQWRAQTKPKEQPAG